MSEELVAVFLLCTLALGLVIGLGGAVWLMVEWIKSPNDATPYDVC